MAARTASRYSSLFPPRPVNDLANHALRRCDGSLPRRRLTKGANKRALPLGSFFGLSLQYMPIAMGISSKDIATLLVFSVPRFQWFL
jgi:hypothetical protein